MSSSFFLLIRKLKNANVYARELARQYALFKSVSDQVDNPRFKAYSRLKNYRLVIKENPTIHQGPASEYKPYVPGEGNPPTPPGSPPPPPGPISNSKFAYANTAIDAIGNDGNLPANVNDGSLVTRWSYQPLPAWIRVNLGAIRRIAFVRIAWHKGNERVMGFSIETSNSATTGYTTRMTTSSSGETTGFETYDFTDVNAQYVRITATSNSVPTSIGNLYASISELEIWGGNDTNPSPPPPGPPAPPGSPPPPGPPPAGAEPQPQGIVSVMLNFNNTIQDASGMSNHALIDGGTLKFATGATSATGQAIDLNPFSPGSSPPPPPPPPGTPPPPGPPPPPSPQPVTSRMKYFDGPLLNKYNVEIYNIWWGSGWNSGTSASRKSTLMSYYNTIINSDHYKGMWQYGGVKTPIIANNNVVHTSTPLPSATNVTFAEIETMIENCWAAGQIPNPEQYGEPAMGLGKMDYRHLFFVHMANPKVLPAGFGGASSVGYKHVGGTVWYNWSSVNPPFYLDSRFPDFNEVQMAAQAWAHEVMHHLESPYPGGCTEGHRGYVGYVYFHNGECAGIQHASVGCGSRLRLLTGTNVCTESYWSDMDGKCIAPGTGDTWTRPP